MVGRGSSTHGPYLDLVKLVMCIFHVIEIPIVVVDLLLFDSMNNVMRMTPSIK